MYAFMVSEASLKFSLREVKLSLLSEVSWLLKFSSLSEMAGIVSLNWDKISIFEPDATRSKPSLICSKEIEMLAVVSFTF